MQSFAIQQNGLLSEAYSTVPSGGNAPAYTVALTSGQVAVMNVSKYISILSAY